jgi:RNA polymerase sigma factor for flagellar operon FliA
VTAQSDTDVAGLWQALQELGDRSAREQLIVRYGEFARMVAAKLYGTRPDDTVPFEDYLQYARVGLIEALDRFDASRGTSFESYSSYRIRGSILNGLSRHTELHAQRSHWRELIAERRHSLQEAASGRDASDVTLEDFARLAVGLAIGLMLDDPGAAAECADQSVEANPYDATELRQMRERVRALVDELPARERDILRRHYYEQCEFQEIAADLGVTKGRVSQLHARALQRVREALNVAPRIDRKV